jgi:hypothetical protein
MQRYQVEQMPCEAFDIVAPYTTDITRGSFIMNRISKASVLAGAIVIGGLTVSGAAMARVSVGVNIGIPGPVYAAPAPVYAPPPPVYAPPPPPVVYAPPPPPVYAAPAIVIGWHGDRYWDGRRYWGRDEWYRHNGGGRYYGHDYGHRGWH